MVTNTAIQFFKNTVAALDRRMAKATCDSDRSDILHHVLPHLDSPKGLSLAELQSTVRSVMIAGSETSASILTSAHYFVLSNRRIYKRLLAEVRHQFALNSDITGVTVSKCKYMIAVLEETMRIWPAIAISLPRLTPPKGCEIDGYWVPGGIKVGVNQWAAYHSDRNFTRPDEFLPERWLDEGKEEFGHDDRASFQPFGVGPRNCLGMT
jgi:cytochrome P450